MATQRIVNTESSVLFNLRELMQLEHERVQSELDAAREAAAEVERLRIEEARRAESAVARSAREREAEQERVKREREAALLHVRLEAEAVERRASEELALLHAREFQRVQLAARRKRGWAFGVTLVAAAIGASGVHALLRMRPVSEVAAVVPRVEAAGLPVDQARELATLRELVARLSQPREAPTAAAAEAGPVGVVARTRTVPKNRLTVRRSAPPREDHSLDGLDDATNDPISDM